MTDLIGHFHHRVNFYAENLFIVLGPSVSAAALKPIPESQISASGTLVIKLRRIGGSQQLMTLSPQFPI